MAVHGGQGEVKIREVLSVGVEGSRERRPPPLCTSVPDWCPLLGQSARDHLNSWHLPGDLLWVTVLPTKTSALCLYPSGGPCPVPHNQEFSSVSLGKSLNISGLIYKTKDIKKK